MKHKFISAVYSLTLVLLPLYSKGLARDLQYGFGRPANKLEMESVDISIDVKGLRLPLEGATAMEGEGVYRTYCASCHGVDLKGSKIMHAPRLVGGRESLISSDPLKTVESYWPYASTLFDYIRRAMPFGTPGVLSDHQVYAVTAYILFRANLVRKDQLINQQTLPKVKMPNRSGFVNHMPAVYL